MKTDETKDPQEFMVNKSTWIFTYSYSTVIYQEVNTQKIGSLIIPGQMVTFSQKRRMCTGLQRVSLIIEERENKHFRQWEEHMQIQRALKGSNKSGSREQRESQDDWDGWYLVGETKGAI